MSIYFGGDLSTTSVTLKAIDGETLQIVDTYKVNLDDLAHPMGIQTKDGILEDKDTGYRRIPGKVLVKAVQEVMQQAAKDTKYKNSDVVAGSWSVQGHLGAYLQGDIVDVLSSVKGGDLATLTDGFFTCDCPTWQDNSTKKEVLDLNNSMSQANLNVITVEERFPGPQILKRVDTASYNDADIIAVGNALASLIITGKPTFSGPGDAAASGFVDLETLTLDRKAMDIIDTKLHEKVAEVTPAGGMIGEASPFFKNMGFTNLKMYVGDQDNVKSAAYLISNPNVLQVSLGTSYTTSIVSTSTIPGFAGNFASNDSALPYLLLLCKQNGSKSISGVLKEHGFDEENFGKISGALSETVPGNDGAMALPYFVSEIVPYHDASGLIRIGYEDAPTFKQDMRAAVEGNAASMKRWSQEYFGPKIDGDFSALSFAGGASNNQDMVRIWVDMFGIPAYSMKQAGDAAAIGAALTAMADSSDNESLQTILPRFLKVNVPKVTEPNAAAANFYEKSFLPEYQRFETAHMQKR